MASVFDVLNRSAFSLTEMTASVNNRPYTPSVIRDMGLFAAKGVTTNSVMVEELNGEISLIKSSQRGQPAPQQKAEKRNVRSLVIPHIKKADTIYAYEIVGVREFGTVDALKTMQGEVSTRQDKLANDADLTEENLLLGAVQGVVLDADGSVLVDLYDAFGVAKLADVDFGLDSSTTDVRGICHQTRREMASEMGQWRRPQFAITALCGDTFFDNLIAHPAVSETYKYQEGQKLREGMAYGQFDFGGITFINYEGNAQVGVYVDTNECSLFPNVPGLFELNYGPGDYEETVNTRGLPRYSSIARDPMHGRWAEVEVQANPLPLCYRPRALRQGKRA